MFLGSLNTNMVPIFTKKGQVAHNRQLWAIFYSFFLTFLFVTYIFRVAEHEYDICFYQTWLDCPQQATLGYFQQFFWHSLLLFMFEGLLNTNMITILTENAPIAHIRQLQVIFAVFWHFHLLFLFIGSLHSNMIIVFTENIYLYGFWVFEFKSDVKPMILTFGSRQIFVKLLFTFQKQHLGFNLFGPFINKKK